MHGLRSAFHSICVAGKNLKNAHAAQEQSWHEGTTPSIKEAKFKVLGALVNCEAAKTDLACNQSGASSLPEAVSGAWKALSSAVCRVDVLAKASHLLA